MKRIFNLQILLGFVLIVLSASVYFVHFLIFRDAHHIFIYLVGDVAFVFLEVLLVTMVIHKVLHDREKKAMLHKLNMIIGAFFSEVGMDLLKILSDFEPESSRISRRLVIPHDCSQEMFLNIQKNIKNHALALDVKRGELEEVKRLLKEKRPFLLNLLENPTLLEHESFTNLLWAVFHLTEELHFRKSFKGLPETDYGHLSQDMKRAYKLLILEWVSYLKHLKCHYAYLFSLAVRTNPFDDNASVEVK